MPSQVVQDQSPGHQGNNAQAARYPPRPPHQLPSSTFVSLRRYGLTTRLQDTRGVEEDPQRRVARPAKRCCQGRGSGQGPGGFSRYAHEGQGVFVQEQLVRGQPPFELVHRPRVGRPRVSHCIVESFFSAGFGPSGVAQGLPIFCQLASSEPLAASFIQVVGIWESVPTSGT